MLKKSKHTSKNLRQKLKNVLTDLTVDVFGYQKKINSNIISHTEYISKEIQVPKERIFLKIFQKDHAIKAYLFDHSKAIKSLPVDQLVYFFVDRDTANLLGIQNKIAFGIKKYLSDFANENSIDSESIDMWIHVKDDKVLIQAFSKDQLIQDISIGSLIKFFR